ncbi:MAG: hypothetical protein M1832_000968 [Thelocarpon impressellum]|nr:MAG: hypothetical protein M1832_000968 [Thelocarpon impressellum]
MAKPLSSPPPASILIVGAGVFGLSTALALTRRPRYAHTNITLLDRATFPAPDASSVDSSRIIRADYSDPAYAALAAEAQTLWRTDEWGGEGRYSESGLLLTAENGGERYVRRSFENVRRLQADEVDEGRNVRELRSAEEIAQAAGTGGGGSGSWGYLNPRSGWADATASMQHVYDRLVATQRVRFVAGEAMRLLRSEDGATLGVEVRDAPSLQAEQTVLATGAWTPALLDLRGRATATAQTVAYVDLSAAEARTLADIPVLLNLSSGHFITPPHPRLLHLKVARHAYGYANPRSFPHPERSGGGEHLTASTPPLAPPPPGPQGLPPSAVTSLRQALSDMVPSLASRPFSHTRLCWYTDTPAGDFLVCPHPSIPSLLLATGGSGHGFKFLPVLGDKILDRLEGLLLPDLARRWAWPDRGVDGVSTEDGSRAGERGLVLSEEMGDE